jgi:hypothetical protein
LEVRKLATLAVLAFFAWIFITFTWATAAHLTGLPGPARASAATLELAARAVTLADPPGAIGRPQRMAAGNLRKAARMAERLHRGPERAVARVLDRMGHRHSHQRHAFAGVSRRAPIVMEFGDWDAAWHEGLSEALRELSENEALLELRRLNWLEQGERSSCCRRRSLERSQESIERSREHLERSRERISRSMERLQDRLDRLDAGDRSEVSDRLKERLRDMLRELKRELEDLLEDGLESGAIIEISDESMDEVQLFGPTIAIKIHEKGH